MGVVFPYTKLPGGNARPMVFGTLQYATKYTPPVQLLLDTGSDYCIFDALLAQQLLGINVASAGRLTKLFGLEREVDAYVLPIAVHVRELKRTFEIPEAYFCTLGNLGGILGHHGFLDCVSVHFQRGKSFEFVDSD